MLGARSTLTYLCQSPVGGQCVVGSIRESKAVGLYVPFFETVFHDNLG